MVKIVKYKIKLSNGSFYTTNKFQDDGTFLIFTDIKGSKRWVNKKHIEEFTEINKGE